MKVSKSTIIRTVMLLIVLLNLILERFGIDVIRTDESTILKFVEYIIEMAVIVVSWWYNNSFSQKALKAQKYLEALKEEEYNV
ncbi:MAG: phage holin [Clostridia bacterium]|nr:phage holin [Clostridia bacterium]MBQ2236859.1 phage holin [Clostridia bacterium]MEE1185585.1 phage holin [Acutalibacteraceae bacterium]